MTFLYFCLLSFAAALAFFAAAALARAGKLPLPVSLPDRSFTKLAWNISPEFALALTLEELIAEARSWVMSFFLSLPDMMNEREFGGSKCGR